MKMGQRKDLVGLVIACFFLIGTNSVMGAMWDRHCQVAIEDLQVLQHEIVTKKQEIETARVVEAIPSNFMSGQLEVSLKPSSGKAQAVSDMKLLFQNVEFAVAEFSRSCLKRNRFSQ